jgi:hypothetical protein
MNKLEDTQRSFGVKNVSTALMVILEIFTRHIDDLQEGFLDENFEPIKPITNYVPIESIFGDTNIPPKVASVIRKIIAKADKKKDQFDLLYKALETGLESLNK